MLRTISAQVALLAFAAATLAGLAVGNAPLTVLLRALAVMLGALIVGQAVAWAAKLVIRDHLLRHKLAIDREHVAATTPPQPGSEASA